MNRRSFVKNSGLAISALPLMTSTFNRKKYKIALIGSGWWGMNILREAIAFGNCKIVGLCDVDMLTLQTAQDEIKTLNGDRPKAFKDYRELIYKTKPDIVIIGTPDHWHALPAIAAIKAGAHVYLEKPIGHTIGEGQAILKHARANERIVQVGTHRRISPHNISGMKFLKDGGAGEISQVKAFINYNQGAGKVIPDEDAPAQLDWDMYVGPAAYQEYNRKIHPKGFRHFLNFANGMIGDWGIHWFDQVLWWTDEKFPTSVYSTGGRYVKADNSDAPDTQMAIYNFESFEMTWEHRLCAPSPQDKHNVGCYFHGTKGTFHMGWLDGWTFYPADKNKEIINQKHSLNLPDHQNIKELWTDFLQSIESNELPVCDIEKGHLATNMSLLAMISLKTGRSVNWDGDQEVILNDPEAQAMIKREYRGDWVYPS